MPDTTRTFVAVALPEALAPRLERLQAGLVAEVPNARPTVTKPFHVTLAFLGDVPHSDLAAVCRVVTEAAETFKPFELGLRGTGAFPDPARPRVIWAGLEGPGLASLNDLQAALVVALRGLGYSPEGGPFRPHVTLARMKPGGKRREGTASHQHQDLTSILKRRDNWAAGPFRITEAVTFGSTFTEEGPAYARLGRAPLKGRSAP